MGSSPSFDGLRPRRYNILGFRALSIEQNPFHVRIKKDGTAIMPKATAVWLVDNTALTFEQISNFCGLHTLEVQAIADGEVATGMQGLDPTLNGQLSKEEIVRCEADPAARMGMNKPSVPLPKVRQKGARYTPISKRQDRPDAIAWLIKAHPELSDAQISRLIGTTKPTINAVRDKTHHNTPNLTPQSPVYLGLCSGADLERWWP